MISMRYFEKPRTGRLEGSDDGRDQQTATAMGLLLTPHARLWRHMTRVWRQPTSLGESRPVRSIFRRGRGVRCRRAQADQVHRQLASGLRIPSMVGKNAHGRFIGKPIPAFIQQHALL